MIFCPEDCNNGIKIYTIPGYIALVESQGFQTLLRQSCKLLEKRKRGYENNNKDDIRGINCEYMKRK